MFRTPVKLLPRVLASLGAGLLFCVIALLGLNAVGLTANAMIAIPGGGMGAPVDTSQVPTVSPASGTVQWVAPVNVSGNKFTITAPAACPASTTQAYVWVVKQGYEDTIGNAADQSASTTLARGAPVSVPASGPASGAEFWAAVGFRAGIAAQVQAGLAGSPVGTQVLDHDYSLGIACDTGTNPGYSTYPTSVSYVTVHLTGTTTAPWPAGTDTVNAPIAWSWSVVAGSGGTISPAPPTFAQAPYFVGSPQGVAPGLSGDVSIDASAVCPDSTVKQVVSAWLVKPGGEATIGDPAYQNSADTIGVFNGTTDLAAGDTSPPVVNTTWFSVLTGLSAQIPSHFAGSPSGTQVLSAPYSLGLACADAASPGVPTQIWYVTVNVLATTTAAWPSGTAAANASINWVFQEVPGTGGAVTPVPPPSSPPPTTAPPTTPPPTTPPPSSAPPTTPPPSSSPSPSPSPTGTPNGSTSGAPTGGTSGGTGGSSGLGAGTGSGTGTGSGSGTGGSTGSGAGTGASSGTGAGAASGTGTVSAEVTFTGPTGAILSYDPTLTPGEQITVSASGYTGSEKVSVTAHSSPVSLGAFPAASGTVMAKITIPATLPVGSHIITLTGEKSHVTKSAPFRIGTSAAAAGAGGTSGNAGSASSGELTNAGFNVSSPISIAVYVVGMGIAVLSLTLWSGAANKGRWRRFFRPVLQPRRGQP